MSSARLHATNAGAGSETVFLLVLMHTHTNALHLPSDAESLQPSVLDCWQLGQRRSGAFIEGDNDVDVSANYSQFETLCRLYPAKLAELQQQAAMRGGGAKFKFLAALTGRKTGVCHGCTARIGRCKRILAVGLAKAPDNNHGGTVACTSAGQRGTVDIYPLVTRAHHDHGRHSGGAASHWVVRRRSIINIRRDGTRLGRAHDLVMPLSWLSPAQPCSVSGVQTTCPANPDAVLELLYGPGWRTPLNWQAAPKK